ncbi:MAG TPA: WG repeat-containing protein, partial [Bacteroidales bacterium]|nr:WG repeat-containing protein [Bacteroidales bacterium]
YALVKDVLGYYGLIDCYGKEVVPPNYKKIGKFNKTVHNYALVKDVLGYYGLIDCYGKEVSAMHEDDSEDEE